MKLIYNLSTFAVFGILLLFIVFPIPSSYAAAPEVPTSCAPSAAPETTTMTLTWAAPSGTVTGYKIETATETSFDVFGSFSTIVATTGNTDVTKTLTGLDSGQFFKIKISAINDDGTGPACTFYGGTKHSGSADHDYSAGQQNFSEGQVFGEGTKFANSQTFTNAQTFGASQTFGTGGTFAVANTWGDKADFSAGTQTFTTAQTFGTAAKFAANQDFTNVDHDFTGAAMFFNSGGAFSAGEVMGMGADFSTGIQTFGSGMTFGEATEFAASQDWGANPQTFDKYMHFGESNDFTGRVQAFKEGTSFGSGTTFRDSQTMPLNTIPSFGVMLEQITCGTDTSADTCIPNDASKYLSPGEFLTPGQDPAATSSSISSNDRSFAVEGAGLEMTFATVSGDGTITSDLYDPANIPDSTAVEGTAGKVSVNTTNTGNVQTIGSVTNISTGTATISGDITVKLSYSEANIPAGTVESELTMIHYTGGQWKTEDSCDVDTVNNKISCTVTSLSPFGVGGSGGSSSSGGGGNNCDSNGFGNNNSLRVYQVSYDIDTYQVLVNAYSTCGSISAKMTTPMQQSILGLSTEQTLLDDRVAIYSGYLDESDEKFNISIQNKRDSFYETFYINDKSIIKQYTGNTGYTSQQQGMVSPTITSTQTTITSEPSVEEAVLVENEKQIVEEETVLVENEKQIVEEETVLVENEKQIVEEEPVIEYTSEPIEEQTNEEGGGCLIATATYGSEMALEVQQLRELRDNTLLNTESGTAFMGAFNDIYYSFSPVIADYERENPLFKEAVKLAITPMISTLSLMENAESESEVLSLGISIIALNIGMYLGVPAIVVIGIRKRI